MSGAVRGFLITAGLWAALIAMYSIIEVLRGHLPFAMLQWEVGGKFITLVISAVLALGTGVGIASDRIARRQSQ